MHPILKVGQIAWVRGADTICDMLHLVAWRSIMPVLPHQHPSENQPQNIVFFGAQLAGMLALILSSSVMVCQALILVRFLFL